MPKLPPKPLVSEVLDAVHKAKTKAKKIEVLQEYDSKALGTVSSGTMMRVLRVPCQMVMSLTHLTMLQPQKHKASLHLSTEHCIILL